MSDTSMRSEAEGSLLRLVAEAETFEDALAATVRIACETGEWEYGEAWLPDTGNGADFVSSAVYDPTGSFSEFREGDSSVLSSSGEEFIKHVFETHEVAWFDGDEEFNDGLSGDQITSEDLLVPLELGAAVAVPVMANDEKVLAVLAFFDTRPHDTDDTFVEAVATVAGKFGQLVAGIQDKDLVAEERALLREILDASPVGIVIHDMRNGTEMVNEAAASLLGVDIKTVLDRGVDSPMWDVRDENGNQITVDSFPVSDAIADRGAVLDRRIVVGRPDGSEVILSVNAAPLFDTNDEVSRVVLVFGDVTDRAANEAELTEENQQLESFAAVLSHDVRSPLAVATGFLDLTRETGDLAYLDRVENAHERIEELIDTLLVLARKGRMVGPRSLVSLETVAQEAWELVETGSAQLDVEDVGHVEADPVRLRQLLENLFTNAVQHAGPSPHVRLLPLDGLVGFAVEDDGPGIPRDRRAEVLSVGHESSGGGVGLGLSIVAAIAEGHGWEIRMAEGANGGARIEFQTALAE